MLSGDKGWRPLETFRSAFNSRVFLSHAVMHPRKQFAALRAETSNPELFILFIEVIYCIFCILALRNLS